MSRLGMNTSKMVFPEKPNPVDKREQLKNVKLDFDAISDLETADPPDMIDPLPNLDQDDKDSETGPYLVNQPDNSNTLIVILNTRGFGLGLQPFQSSVASARAH